MLTRRQLSFIDRDVGFRDEEYVDVGAGSWCHRVLDDRHSSQREAREGYRQELESILALRYFVVVATHYRVPDIDYDNKTYSGGEAAAELAVYDRATDSWLGGFATTARPGERVDFTLREKWHLERDAPYYIKTSARVVLQAKLREGLVPLLDEKTLPEEVEAPLEK